jgi:porin
MRTAWSTAGAGSPACRVAKLLGWATLAAIASISPPAHAQGADPPEEYVSPEATPETPPAPSAPAPVNLDADFTQFLGLGIDGDGDNDPRYGGRLDLFVTAPITERLTFAAHPEFIYGENINEIGDGSLLPVNTAMAFPEDGKEGFDLSVSLIQRIGERATLSVGKFNLLDRVSRTPILGGGGREGFMNINLAAPPSGLVPPSFIGAILSVPTKRAIFGLWVFDPQSTVQETGFEDPFGSGVNILGSVAVPIRIGGRPGLQNFRVVYSTEEGVDLRDLPMLILPPGTGNIRTRHARWNIAYSFQQFLWTNPDSPRHGWGLFGQVSVSDGNPTPVSWSALLGVAGNLWRSRPKDSFGIAYFHQSFSDPLQNSVAPFFDLGDEAGLEAYYTGQVGKLLRLTGDLQVINPGNESKPTAVLLQIRARLNF